MTDLLFELGCEELPSAAVKPLAKALANNIALGLDKAGLKHGQVKFFSTPRRLAVSISDLQTMQQEQRIVRRGPAYQANVEIHSSPAILGFANSCGVSVERLTLLETDKGQCWAYETVQAGKHARHILPEIITAAISELQIPKPMRWGSLNDEFARPVHWAVLLLGDEVIAAPILGVTAGRLTRGHRFHAPQTFEIRTPSHYEAILKERFVTASFDERRRAIEQQIQQLAEQVALCPVLSDDLLDEVTSIVEWPQALLAQFKQEFLEVPHEALIAAMQVHQKCFALRQLNGSLSPYFITIANIESHCPKQVIAGNEKVMHARLSDAAFFYRQDKKRPLSALVPATQQVVFQAKLGSLADKTERMGKLMEKLSTPLQLELQEVKRAAQLSKCDLLTGMVGEFPELQGVMGYYYACHDGEPLAVAQALKEQYMPRFASDDLPQSKLGLALSLADRLDTLVGIFVLGQKPTGTKDPFKLRRHALAVIRILTSLPQKISLSSLLQKMCDIYGDSLPDHPERMQELHVFILERMPAYYQAQGISADIIQAVHACEKDELFDMERRIKSLHQFLEQPEAAALSAACKRVNNLLQKISVDQLSQVDPSLFIESNEHRLFAEIQNAENKMRDAYQAGDYTQVLNILVSLRAPLDNFFEHVMVLIEDQVIAKNRLALLLKLKQLLQRVADISLIVK